MDRCNDLNNLILFAIEAYMVLFLILPLALDLANIFLYNHDRMAYIPD